jgi:hypothetical protein
MLENDKKRRDVNYADYRIVEREHAFASSTDD